MAGRIKSIIGGALTGGVISYFAVTIFFNPAMAEAGEALAEGLVPNMFASTALFWIVAILFFDWAVQKTGQTMHTAWVIGLSQILLVDINYVLIGRRELEPALYSIGIIFVIWWAVAFVYDKLSETS